MEDNWEMNGKYMGNKLTNTGKQMAAKWKINGE